MAGAWLRVAKPQGWGLLTVRGNVLRTCPTEAEPRAKVHCAVAGPPLESSREPQPEVA